MGRPKEFDPAVAVDQAMDVFWSRGYGATTPQQLAERLQIGKGSLYNTFGDKRSLFDVALRRYLDTRVQSVGVMLESSGPAKQILRQVLLFMIDTDFERPERRGCFATNTAVEFGRDDESVAAAVLEFFASTEAAFHALVERGQRDGDIRPELRAADVASMLLNTAIGVHALSRVEPGPERPRRVVDATLELL